MNHVMDLRNSAVGIWRPFLLLTVTSFIWLSGPRASAEETDASSGSQDSGRSVHFLENCAVGKLYIRDAAALGHDLGRDYWTLLCSAQGSVKVPAGKQLRLTVPESVELNLRPLEKLGPDELQALDLRNTAVDDTWLASIAHLTGLRALRLDRTQVTAAGLGRLKGLTSLRYLSLNDLPVGHEGLAQIAGLVSLETLELERSGVTDLSLAHLQSLKQIKHLKVGGNAITDAGLLSLAPLASLEELELDSTLVADAGMPQLTGLKSLRRIAFPLQITQTGIDLFKGLPRFEMPFPRKNMVVRVVDEDGKTPVSCTATVSSTTSCSSRAPQEFAVDESGVLQFAYSVTRNGFLSVTTEKTGYPSMSVFWTDTASTSMPVDLTISMEKGITIGGRVMDERGQGIPNAQVIQRVANAATNGNDAGSHPGVPSPGVGGYDSIRTDAEGFWRANRVPKDFAGGGFQAIHPDYCSHMRDSAFRRSFSREELISQTAVTVMKRGLTVMGTVLDREGRPVIDAIVSQGEEYAIGIPPTHTDGDGRYEFKHVFPGELSLTVSADGYASTCQQMTLTEDPPPIDFKLEPARTIHGKVVDMEGRPVPGAYVSANLGNRKPARVWYTVTGPDGYFCWNNAPSERVLLDVDAEEYERGTKHSMIAGATEYVITLFDRLKVVGTVVDALSGKPLKDFEIYEGNKDSHSNQFYWSPASYCTVGDGTFEVTYRDPSEMYMITVKKAGYLPMTSEPFRHGHRVVPLEFRLGKGGGPTGIVKASDGQILTGVDVYLVPSDYGFALNNGRVEGIGGECEVVKTDDSGRYVFSSQPGTYKIVVADESGYAEVHNADLKSSTDCLLKPWGKVAVDLRVGNLPAAAEEVRIDYGPPEKGFTAPIISYIYEGRADSDGHCEFDRVLPGTATIERSLSQEPRVTAYRHSREVVVKPGETTHVTLGGTGCPIIGRIVVPSDSLLQGQLDHSSASIRLTMPWPYDQKTLDRMNDSEREAWRKEYFGTEAGEEYQRRLKEKPCVSFAVNPDGSFKVPDVSPGTYDLNVSVYRLNADQPSRKDTAARIERQKITIPDLPGGRSDVPFDLGELPLKLF